jgi:hypothetical protein
MWQGMGLDGWEFVVLIWSPNFYDYQSKLPDVLKLAWDSVIG